MAKKKDQPAKEGLAGLKSGFVTDFISGKQVKSGPEEVQAVQVFARRLVEDYAYPRDRSGIRGGGCHRPSTLPPIMLERSGILYVSCLCFSPSI
jgi:hypothetical protein